jgi:hypothetical protein
MQLLGNRRRRRGERLKEALTAVKLHCSKEE